MPRGRQSFPGLLVTSARHGISRYRRFAPEHKHFMPIDAKPIARTRSSHASPWLDHAAERLMMNPLRTGSNPCFG